MANDAPLTAQELQSYLATARPGTPEYVTAKQMLDGMSGAKPAAAAPIQLPEIKVTPDGTTPPPPPGSPGAPSPPRYVEPEGAVKPWGPPEIDYNAPIANVRTALNAVPEGPDRTAGWNKWADIQEAQQHNQGGISGLVRSINDHMRGVAQGTPIGKWGDRINAGVASVLPEAL